MIRAASVVAAAIAAGAYLFLLWVLRDRDPETPEPEGLETDEHEAGVPMTYKTWWDGTPIVWRD